MRQSKFLSTKLLSFILMTIQFAVSNAQTTKPNCTTFTDVTELAKVNGPWDCGTAFGDFNNDGFLDFYIGNRSGSNALFMNSGNGTFVNMTQEAGVGFEGWTTGVSWADFNNDGKLDLYVCNHNIPNILFLNQGNGTFKDIAIQAGVGCSLDSYFGSWADYNNDGFVDIYIANFEVGESNVLYHNNGDGTFSDVTSIAGVDGHPYAKSRGVAWGDYNNDGFLDLFVNNQGEDVLYRNNQDGTFTEVTNEMGIYNSGNGYGCAWGDYNNDGFLDLFVANRDTRGVLFANQWGNSFIDVTISSGLDIATGVIGCACGDLDNDGDLDLYLYDAWGRREYLFMNNGKGKFIEEIITSGLQNYSSGNTASLGDYDNDGDLDLLTTTYMATGTHLYQNNGNNNNWLVINLVGTISNRSAIGARVHLAAHSISQIQEVSGGAGYYSQNSLPLEFGLGQTQKVDSLRISWPSGVIWDTTNISVNQILTIYEERLSHDIMALQILKPNARVEEEMIVPQVVIKNVGINDETNFSVKCFVDSSGSIVYADTQTIDYLASLDKKIIAFAPWFPARGTAYIVRFITYLPNDLNSKNDEIYKKIIAPLAHDIKMNQIVSPSHHFSERSVTPIASIQNNGYFAEFLFDVTCEVYDSQSLVYRGTQTVMALAPLDTLKIYFGMWEVPGEGPFSIKFFSRLIEDQDQTNDTLFMNITYDPWMSALSKESTAIPESFSLSNVFPNPFNEMTQIEYEIPHTSGVTIDIYDLVGRHIRNIVNDQKKSGIEIVTWDARDDRGQPVVSGVYLIRMRAKNFEYIRKILYLK